METVELLKKYNVAAPRYTSYPTVPYWENHLFEIQHWHGCLKSSYKVNKDEGISLYIHLPFCESLCTYCGCNTRITKNHKVEEPYIETVLKEWQMYVDVLGEQPKIKEIHLGGGTPTFFSAENLNRLLKGIIGEEPDNDVECSFEGHPDNTTIAHLQTLSRLGFKRLSLGIQDFDPRVQFMINRFQTPEQVKQITEQARAIGYESINYDLIYGLPGQHVGGLVETIKQVITLKPDRIAFYSYAHVPWLKPGQRHFTEQDIPQGDEKFSLYKKGRAMLLEAGYEEIGMDHFALTSDSLYTSSISGQMHRNFMGYTSQRTQILIGLGVSSISDCGTAFAQNAKTVEGYQSQINNSRLAVEKGHLLTDQDLEIRQHILNLMCRNRTSFSEKIPSNIEKRLKPLIEDKLVYLGEHEIEITPTGKTFLRNVCMALDERLWQKQPQTQLFSAAI
ncbi:oxygen-independent coproporphyrinogen III oxidase [Pedobacter montanisoli]|uniref:Coproporphyrinogen-III oxidase n=1 Tax=Pedobacter montanisoli TaxID=2923277 RepID=A0ABS9ZZK0_9SPHI|nr:oxygen-independent coproporphyrinogen III oxidase [Pedobacter montanisoli]MCJ0743745.1 oxygen-independent coproporphyrinogen III oxidase [Pedobacter montanisoli]